MNIFQRSGNLLKNQNSRCKEITSLILWGEMKDGILKVCGRKHVNEKIHYKQNKAR